MAMFCLLPWPGLHCEGESVPKRLERSVKLSVSCGMLGILDLLFLTSFSMGVQCGEDKLERRDQLDPLPSAEPAWLDSVRPGTSARHSDTGDKLNVKP